MSPVISAEVVAGTLILAVLLVLTFIFVRRRLLASGAPLMLCALQPHGRTQFRLGLLRFSGSTLEWFSLVGPSMRPARSWQRPRLELEAPRGPAEVVAGLPDALTVRCHYDTSGDRLTGGSRSRASERAAEHEADAAEADLPQVEGPADRGTDTFELAMAPAAYTAMRSWLESSPPGFNVNVA